MSRVATYSGPFERKLHGIAGLGMAICLDQSQNTIACTDPECTYGDCGSTDTQLVGGSLCLDRSQNQIPCSNPECTYGDCLPSTAAPKPAQNIVAAATTAASNLVPRPSPTVGVPLSPSSLGLWFSGTTFGLPNWALGVGVLALAVGLASGGGRRR